VRDDAASAGERLERRGNLLVRRELVLPLPDKHSPDDAGGVDQEQRRPGDVPRVDPDAVPHAVRLDDRARVIDEDVEGEARVLDVAADLLRSLRDNRRDLDAAREILRGVLGQFTEPAAAVGSPGAAVKGKEQRSCGQQVRQRPNRSLLRRQRKRRRPVPDPERV